MVDINRGLLEAGGIEAIFEKRSKGKVITISLTRERTLNALLPETFRALHAVLDAVPVDDLPSQLLIAGRGRAFSAGGDVRSLRAKLQAAGEVNSAERQEIAHEVLEMEYKFLKRLSLLHEIGVETIGVADGIAFGAGNGLFQACQRRLVTERAVLGMPECRIGLVPDCGASHFFIALPGCVGMFAALTGARVTAGDALTLGLADGTVPVSWRGASLTGEHLDNNSDNGDVAWQSQQLPSEVTTELADSGSALRRGIDDAFSRDSMDEVLSRLTELAATQKWARAALAAIRAASPRAVAETFRVMRDGYANKHGGLDAALKRELDADTILAACWDFEEGVRAALVDKDNQPKWESFYPSKCEHQ